ncbi:hypothetical protein D9613_012832 [Agrocybe pediades]|uniref:Nephrocystin 3-like N-terminal domain-containing protein n=1 Tax=Agrocybe pediades TaxID=84607 RepID=A0A8H4R1K7_9AGAR|nr:hypothetical protein D9613_012832 [Agrocybe pediades]
MTQPEPQLQPSMMHLSHTILNDPTFNQHNFYHQSGAPPGYLRLIENVSIAALHDSVHAADPPKPNTRHVAIIQCIIDWVVGVDPNLSGKSILWLEGGAGARKSAIARSVAKRCSDEGLLLGTFFFGAADSTRNHVGNLVATISSQIGIVLPEFRDTVAAFVEEDPLIFGRSIKTQFSTLIIRPLSKVLANRAAASTTTPRLIIIDGLNECSSIDSQQGLLFTLQEASNDPMSPIRFLVCSRPESHLNSALCSSDMVPILHKIFLDDDHVARQASAPSSGTSSALIFPTATPSTLEAGPSGTACSHCQDKGKERMHLNPHDREEIDRLARRTHNDLQFYQEWGRQFMRAMDTRVHLEGLGAKPL